MKLLLYIGTASLCLSLLSLLLVALARKKYLAYIGQGFFIFSVLSTAAFAVLHREYFFAIASGIFATAWLYKLITGKIVTSPL